MVKEVQRYGTKDVVFDQSFYDKGKGLFFNCVYIYIYETQIIKI